MSTKDAAASASDTTAAAPTAAEPSKKKAALHATKKGATVFYNHPDEGKVPAIVRSACAPIETGKEFNKETKKTVPVFETDVVDLTAFTSRGALERRNVKRGSEPGTYSVTE